MARSTKGSQKELGDGPIIVRLQSILINAAEGRRSIADDAQYTSLRREINRRPIGVPEFVSTHKTVDSFVAYIKGIADRRERVRMVRDDFESVLSALPRSGESATDSTSWTGPKRPVERLRAVRTLIPVARVAVESMIATLSEPNPNGAPILEEREQALKNLRELHRILGELLKAVDAGHFDDELGQGLAAEAARYAKKAARSLRDDPMPYVSSALLLGIFTACGFPGIGGYMADVALNVTKHLRK